MVVINDDGREIQFPSEYSEITIKQLDAIAEIFETDITETEQWILVVSYLAGIPKEVVEDWPMTEFMNICHQLFTRMPEAEPSDTIELEGYTYKVTPYDYLTARETALVEKIFTVSKKNRFAKVLAVIFKREDLTKTEHFANAHITYKSELFGSLKADTMLGHLSKFGIQFLENLLETVNEDQDTTGDTQS